MNQNTKKQEIYNYFSFKWINFVKTNGIEMNKNEYDKCDDLYCSSLQKIKGWVSKSKHVRAEN